MDQANFHHDLTDLLEDPVTHLVMARDRVDMTSFIALLQRAQQHLREACAPDHRSDA